MKEINGENENTMNKELLDAKNLLVEGKYTCVAIKGEQIYTSKERGVKPLLAWLDKGINLSGFSVADKVIGNGAAMLYVLLGVKEIYTPVISKPAQRTLQMHGVDTSFDVCVEGICNRTNTGPCPMEAAVEGIVEPEAAVLAIRKKLIEI